jgi:AcrR family transcriptional regulator
VELNHGGIVRAADVARDVMGGEVMGGEVMANGPGTTGIIWPMPVASTPTPAADALRRNPKQPRGERRLQAILDAAAVVFDEVGYEAASTVLIAKRANTAVGSLYDFFPNKQAIAARLSEQFAADLRALFDPLIVPELTQAPLPHIIDGLIDALVDFIHHLPGFRALYLKSPHIGQMSPSQRTIEELLTNRITAMLQLYFPHCTHEAALRTTRVSLEVTKALTGLAILSPSPDVAVIADLKRLLVVCIEHNLGPGRPAGP